MTPLTTAQVVDFSDTTPKKDFDPPVHPTKTERGPLFAPFNPVEWDSSPRGTAGHRGAPPGSSDAPAVESDFGSSSLFLDPSKKPSGNIPPPCAEQATSNQQLLDCVGYRMGARMYPEEDGCCGEKYQFSDERYAVLLKPGDYGDLTIRVGYYTQVMGLGEDRTAVQIGEAKVDWGLHPPAYETQVNFWRSIENFKQKKALRWHTSQAAPARNLEVSGGYSVVCNSGDTCWGSGGYFADIKFSGGNTHGYMGQQWFQRNCDMTAVGGSKNTVSVGIKGAVKQTPWVDAAPFIAEKPHFVANKDGTFSLHMFAPEQDKVGASPTSAPLRKSIQITKGMLVKPGGHTGAELSAQLADKQVLIFLPGIHTISGSISVASDDSVIYGLGYPQLKQAAGGWLIDVKDGLSHVTIVGFMPQSSADSEGIIRWGATAAAAAEPALATTPDAPAVAAPMAETPAAAALATRGNASASTRGSCSKASYTNFIQDIFPVFGGTGGGIVDKAIEINDDCVIVDHIWIWAADHGPIAGYSKARVNKGLVVNGAGVMVYGAFIEHVSGEHVRWNGEGGKMFMLQTELPYFNLESNPPSSKQIFPSGSAPFVITASSFEAWGLGIYVVFDYHWDLLYAIQVPPYNGLVKIEHSFFWFITSKKSFDANYIKNVLGESGNAVGNCGENNALQTGGDKTKICPRYR